MWLAHETFFASQSRAKGTQIRSQLAASRKGRLSTIDYFMHIKKLTDQLAIACQALKCDHYSLGDLRPEYDSFISTVGGREHITLQEVYSMLLTDEARTHTVTFCSKCFYRFPPLPKA